MFFNTKDMGVLFYPIVSINIFIGGLFFFIAINSINLGYISLPIGILIIPNGLYILTNSDNS